MTALRRGCRCRRRRPSGRARRTLRTSGRPVSSASSIGADGRNRSRCSGVDAARRSRPACRARRAGRASITAIRSARRSASSMKWVTSRTVTPRSRIVLDELPRVAAGLRVEAGRQLVEDRDPRVADERERDREPLLLAAGQLAERRCCACPRDRGRRAAGRQSARRRVERGVELERLADADLVGQLALLELDADDARGARRGRAAGRARARGSCPSRASAGRAIDSTVVVLPAPFGPRMAKISPSSTEKDTPSTAVRSP